MGNEHGHLKKEFNNNKNIEKDLLKKSKSTSDDENNFQGNFSKRNKKDIENYDKKISKMLFDDDFGSEQKPTENNKNQGKNKNDNLKSFAQQIADENFMEEINRSKSLDRETQKNIKDKKQKRNIKFEADINKKNYEEKENIKSNKDINKNNKINEIKKLKPENKKRNFLIRMFTPIKKLKNFEEQGNKKSKNVNNISSPNINLNYKKKVSERIPNNKVFKEEDKNEGPKIIKNTLKNPNNIKKDVMKNENINKGYISEGNISKSKQNISTKKKQVISKDIYDKINQEDLKVVLLHIKNSNNKYQEGLDLFNNKNYSESKDCFNQVRNSFMNLNKLINNNPSAYPSEFRVMISLKISEKMRETLKLIKECNSFLIHNKYNKPEKTSKSQEKTNNLNFNLIHKKSSNIINSKKCNSNSNKNIRYKNILHMTNKDVKSQKDNINKNIENYNSNKNNEHANNCLLNKNNKTYALNNQNIIINDKNNKEKINVNNEILLNNNQNNNKQSKENTEIKETLLSEIMLTNYNIKFNDILGMKRLKAILNELKFRQKNIQNILLLGPPGTGKTTICKAFAFESENISFYINTSSLISEYLLETEYSVKMLSKLINEKSPNILILDEIDSIFNKNNNNEIIKKIEKEFLIQLDTLNKNKEKKMLIISITNKPMDLDDKLLKKFNKILYCGPLDKNERYEFLKKTIDKVEHSLSDKDFEEIAKLTEGYSNNDLKELCKEAALMPMRELNTEEILTIKKFRKLIVNDLVKSLNKVKGSLNIKLLEEFAKFTKNNCKIDLF